MSESKDNHEHFLLEEESHMLRFEILLEAAHNSAKRVRLLLIIMVTASILAMGSLWNSYDFSWRDLRINRLAYLVQHLERLENELKSSLLNKEKLNKPAPADIAPQNKTPQVEPSENKVKDLPRLAEIKISDAMYIDDKNKKKGSCLDLEPLGQLNDADINNLFFDFHFLNVQKIEKTNNKSKDESKSEYNEYEINFDLYCSGRKITTLRIKMNEADSLLIEYYKKYLFLGTKGIRDYYTKMISQKREDLNFNIPFFGITFDINDLGFVGGMGFSVILVILYISLIKEFSNTEIAFETSKRVFKKNLVKRRDLYNFISMSQLFSTIPVSGHKRIIEITRLIFLYSPGLFSLLILINDVITFGYGVALDPGKNMTRFELISNGVFFAFIVLFSYKCFKKMKEIDNLWYNEHKEIKIKLDKEKDE